MEILAITKGVKDFLLQISEEDYQKEPLELFKKFYGRYPHKEAIARKKPFSLWMRHNHSTEYDYIRDNWTMCVDNEEVHLRITRYLVMTLGAAMERLDLELGKLVKEMGKTQGTIDVMAMEQVRSIAKAETAVMRAVKSQRETNMQFNIESAKLVKKAKFAMDCFNSLEWKATIKEVDHLLQTGAGLEHHMRSGILDGLEALCKCVTNFGEDGDDKKESGEEEDETS
jgi:hypothetical protein